MDPSGSRSDSSEKVVYPTNRLAHRLLTAEEEVDLANRIEVGLYAQHLIESGVVRDDVTPEELEWLADDGQAAYSEFIHSNLRLVLSQARKFRSRTHSEEDCVQDGYAGLIKGVQRYDHTKGFRFSTYGVWWIREGILTGLRGAETIRPPENLYNQMIKVRAVRLRLLSETGREPSPEDIAAELPGMEVKTVLRCFKLDRPVHSLYLTLADNMTLGDIIDDPEASQALTSVEDRIDHSLWSRVLQQQMALLHDIDIQIIVLRFGMDGKAPRSLVATANELGMTRQQVRVREQKVLKFLRNPDSGIPDVPRSSLRHNPSDAATALVANRSTEPNQTEVTA